MDSGKRNKNPLDEVKFTSSNYDDHYKRCTVSSIDVKEMLWARVELPTSVRGNVGDAVARLMRIGLKAGEPWEKEIEKAINELYRARYGVWLDGGIGKVYNDSKQV